MLAPSQPTDRPLGLRERKKAETRQHISDTATELFLQRGFDAVTVADVAQAADVSVKTVFNYFGAKEDLLFDLEPWWLSSIDALAALVEPGRGLVPVLADAVRQGWPALAFGAWDQLTDEVAAVRRRFYVLIDGHPVLRARMLRMHDDMRRRCADAARETFAEPDGAAARAAGALVGAAYMVTGEEFMRRLLAGERAVEIAEAARSAGSEALAVVAAQYAGTTLIDGPAPADPVI